MIIKTINENDYDAETLETLERILRRYTRTKVVFVKKYNKKKVHIDGKYHKVATEIMNNSRVFDYRGLFKLLNIKSCVIIIKDWGYEIYGIDGKGRTYPVR